MRSTKQMPSTLSSKKLDFENSSIPLYSKLFTYILQICTKRIFFLKQTKVKITLSFTFNNQSLFVYHITVYL